MRDSYGRGFSVSPGTGSPSEWSGVFAIGGAKLPGKGLYASETPSEIASHEASIIATKERAEMKMIEFFILRKLLLPVSIRQSSARLASRFNEVALAFMRLDHVASGIIHAN